MKFVCSVAATTFGIAYQAINEVALRRARLVTGWMNIIRAGITSLL